MTIKLGPDGIRPAKRGGRRAPRVANLLHRERGSALLAVLWLSAALSAIAFAMSMTVRSETERTATSMDDLRSYYLASAGVQKAMVELFWTATSGATFIPTDRPTIDYDLPSGMVHVEIIPETAKLNVNRASADQLVNLMTGLGIDGGRASAIAGGIVLARTPSFQAPQASFQEIEELLSVRGVTPDIFYGTWAATGNGDAGENPLARRPGLNDCLTVYGLTSGDVNAALAVAGATPGGLPAEGARPGAGPGLGGNLLTGGNAIVTFRATARLRLSDGQLSDMRRTVGAQVKYMPYGSEAPFYVLRWYDTAWSY
jgi:general secretion pathway protein K